MNKRILSVDVNIDGLRVVKYQDATQYDKNTHFIGISFMDNVDLVGYALQVYYLPPSPSTTPYVDLFENLTQNMEIPIPNRVLQRNGEVTVEFVLSKNDELITVNQNFSFEVIKTINGTSLTAYPEGALKETIAQQIEKIKALLNQTDKKIEEYNRNSIEKTEMFDENATNKTNTFNTNFDEKIKNFNDNNDLKTIAFNENIQTKTTEFDRHSSEIVTQAYQAMEQQAGISANSAATEANELVVAQQNKSIKEVQTATTESKNNAISEIERKTLEQVEVVKTQGTTSKGEVEQARTTAIDNINTTKTEVINIIDFSKNSAIQALNDEKVKQVKVIESQGTLTKEEVVEEGNKVVRANKTELDTYVNTTSKHHIDTYVEQKEGEIKGATFTPTVDEEGNISWVNDKNLENPTTKNIKGPKGDPGNFIFKVKNRHLMYYTVTNGSSPEFKLNKKHLIIKIK